MTGRKNIKKLQTSPNYRKGYHLYIQWQSQIAKKNWDCQEKIEIAKKLGLPEELPEVSEIPKKNLDLAKPRSKPLNLFQQYWRENMKVTIL